MAPRGEYLSVCDVFLNRHCSKFVVFALASSAMFMLLIWFGFILIRCVSLGTTSSISSVFEQVENMKEKLGVVYYVLGQETMEQVFLSFARREEIIRQADEDAHDARLDAAAQRNKRRDAHHRNESKAGDTHGSDGDCNEQCMVPHAKDLKGASLERDGATDTDGEEHRGREELRQESTSGGTDDSDSNDQRGAKVAKGKRGSIVKGSEGDTDHATAVEMTTMSLVEDSPLN